MEKEQIKLSEEKLQELTQKAVDGQLSEFKEGLKDTVKELALEVFEAHEKSITKGDSEKRSKADEDELTVKFIKALHRGNKSEVIETQKEFVEFEGKSHMIGKAADEELNIATDDQGGYYVPAPILARILVSAERFGLARRLGMVIPMTSDTLGVPRVDSEAEFNSIDEKGNYAALNYQFGNTTLNAAKYGGMVKPTEEFIADANVDVLNMLFMLFGRAQARTEDNLFFSAILADANVTSLAMGSGDTSFEDAVLDDFLDMQDQLDDGADEDAVYVTHKQIKNLLRKIKVDTSNDNRYVWGSPEGNQPRTLWDSPYYTNGKMPSLADDAADTAFAIYGNLANYMLGDRKQMTMKILDQLYAANGMVGVRVDTRIAAGGAIPSDIVVLKTAAEAS